MFLNEERALEAFKKVKLIREHYRKMVVGADMNVLSVEDLQWVIEDMYECKITKMQVPFEGLYVRGVMERHNGNVTIRIQQGLSDDWKRFTAVKELCHVAIDEKEDWSVNGVATIKDLLLEYALESDTEADRVTQSEVFAELAALELMYPFECREGDRQKIKNGTATVITIANHHKMPASMVSRVLTEQYHTGIAGLLWEQIGHELLEAVG